MPQYEGIGDRHPVANRFCFAQHGKAPFAIHLRRQRQLHICQWLQFGARCGQWRIRRQLRPHRRQQAHVLLDQGDAQHGIQQQVVAQEQTPPDNRHITRRLQRCLAVLICTAFGSAPCTEFCEYRYKIRLARNDSQRRESRQRILRLPPNGALPPWERVGEG